MGFSSEIKEDKCEHCGANLWKHGTREETVVVPCVGMDGVEDERMEVIPVRCGKCGHVTPIEYMATGEKWTFQDTIALSAHPEIYFNKMVGR
jgi:RNase P subunit RPR2